MKNHRNGQAAILSDAEYSKIRKQIRSKKYKLLLDLAWYTGERWGALVKLQVADVYREDGTPHEYINFRACTRKATPDGKRQTRQVPVHPVLAEALATYQPEDNSLWLFPCRDGNGAITIRWADMILRAAVDRAGMSAKGISTHSTRRSFITKLHRNGTDLYTIKKITGHRDFKSLEKYVDIDSDRVKGAINAL
ncbi:tyrosine-type recombinase/integrase [Halotia branconii]|uniref:Site-specific integrase n=1 Tax=Halotia branconii CENA392 TaxID=1539056 RepID=A0AAJ6P9L2_9CYAN|nr:site-specific integrase [Halotia branconii]WGV25933.1 site-specific integrase [Halotia branconii CENA392]WGV25949.1 site-specific integrase [Halotia branconii CENA392]